MYFVAKNEVHTINAAQGCVLESQDAKGEEFGAIFAQEARLPYLDPTNFGPSKSGDIPDLSGDFPIVSFLFLSHLKLRSGS